MGKDRKDRFVGSFEGKYTRTGVDGNGIGNTAGRALITIKLAGPSVYLVTVVEDDKTTYNNLAYLEKIPGTEDVLRSEAQSGQGVTSTYFNDKKLVHQVSNIGSKSPTTWSASNFVCRRVKVCC